MCVSEWVSEWVSECVCVCVCLWGNTETFVYLPGWSGQEKVYLSITLLSLSLLPSLSLSLFHNESICIICISFSKSYCFCSCAMWILQTTDTHNATHPLCLPKVWLNQYYVSESVPPLSTPSLPKALWSHPLLGCVEITIGYNVQ